MLKLDIAVTQAFFQADFDTAALINEGCVLPGSVLQCIVAGLGKMHPSPIIAAMQTTA